MEDLRVTAKLSDVRQADIGQTGRCLAQPHFMDETVMIKPL